MEKAEDGESRGWRKSTCHTTHTDYVRIKECLSSHLEHLSNLDHLQKYKENEECKCPG